MYIDHIAIWTNDLETVKSFYMKYFQCTCNEKYINHNKQFQSYFLSFDQGARLEIMQMPNIPANLNNTQTQYLGLIHFAIRVASKAEVDALTSQITAAGHTVVSQPRTSGDGYYESVILDPDGNRVEIIHAGQIASITV